MSQERYRASSSGHSPDGDGGTDDPPRHLLHVHEARDPPDQWQCNCLSATHRMALAAPGVAVHLAALTRMDGVGSVIADCLGD
jgi:hypothetical protein